MALSFLLATRIGPAFRTLKASMRNTKSKPIFEWFEDNYALGLLEEERRAGSERRHPITFEPKFWSVYEQTKLSLPRYKIT